MASGTTVEERQSETYNIVLATYKAMQRSVAELLSKEDLTQPQFVAMRVIAKNGTMSMRRISDAMLVTPANLTGIIDRLEHKGLIQRLVLRGDRRATIIELTKEGRAVQEKVALRYGNFMQRALEAFTAEDQEVLRRLLEKLRREISRRSEEP